MKVASTINLGTWYRGDVFLFEHETLATGEVMVGRYVARLHTAKPTVYRELDDNGDLEYWLYNKHKDDPCDVFLTNWHLRIRKQVGIVMKANGFTQNKVLAMRWATREAYTKDTAGRVEEQEQSRLGELGGKICY